MQDDTAIDILLIGFGPRPGATLAPANGVVETLKAEPRFTGGAGVRVEALGVLNSWTAGPAAVRAALAARAYDGVLLVDRAPAGDVVQFQTHAANAANALPDCLGVRWPGPLVYPGAAAIRPVAAPVGRLARACRAAGTPTAQIEAGDDPANLVLFTLLGTPEAPPAALVRAPLPLETARRCGVDGPAGLNRAQILTAIGAALTELGQWLREIRADRAP